MKIKIIDLLNKIANGENLPKKIKYYNVIWKLKTEKDYFDNGDVDFLNEYFENQLTDSLNDEIEILEDNKEEIEELEITSTSENEFDKWYVNNKHIANQGSSDMAFVDIVNKLNEVIRAVNKLKESDKNV